MQVSDQLRQIQWSPQTDAPFKHVQGFSLHRHALLDTSARVAVPAEEPRSRRLRCREQCTAVELLEPVRISGGIVWKTINEDSYISCIS